MEPTQLQASDVIKEMTVLVLDVVRETEPHGSPGGVMYLALSTLGVSLDTFLIYMGSLVRLGLLTKSHECYHITPIGLDYIRKYQKADERALRSA
jgi:predicted transcriptional regulator